MLETLLHIDRELFVLLNGSGAILPFLDGFMLFVTGKWSAIPLYALLAYSVYRYLGVKGLIWTVAGAIVLITLTDRGSVLLFKEVFERLRPCHEPLLEGRVRLVQASCGGQFGFISSHAANTFGLSAFLFTVLQKKASWIALIFIWASLVGFSRIYLGAHYPGDVLAGGGFGMAIGSAVGLLTRNRISIR